MLDVVRGVRVAHTSDRVWAAGRDRQLGAQSFDSLFWMADEVLVRYSQPPECVRTTPIQSRPGTSPEATTVCDAHDVKAGQICEDFGISCPGRRRVFIEGLSPESFSLQGVKWHSFMPELV